MYCNTYMPFYVVKFYTQKNMLHNKIKKLQVAAIYQAIAAYYIAIVIHFLRINKKRGGGVVYAFLDRKNKKTPGGRRVEPPLYCIYYCCTPRSGVFW